MEKLQNKSSNFFNKKTTEGNVGCCLMVAAQDIVDFIKPPISKPTL